MQSVAWSVSKVQPKSTGQGKANWLLTPLPVPTGKACCRRSYSDWYLPARLGMPSQRVLHSGSVGETVTKEVHIVHAGEGGDDDGEPTQNGEWRESQPCDRAGVGEEEWETLLPRVAVRGFVSHGRVSPEETGIKPFFPLLSSFLILTFDVFILL